MFTNIYNPSVKAYYGGGVEQQRGNGDATNYFENYKFHFNNENTELPDGFQIGGNPDVKERKEALAMTDGKGFDKYEDGLVDGSAEEATNSSTVDEEFGNAVAHQLWPPMNNDKGTNGMVDTQLASNEALSGNKGGGIENADVLSESQTTLA